MEQYKSPEPDDGPSHEMEAQMGVAQKEVASGRSYPRNGHEMKTGEVNDTGVRTQWTREMS